MIRLTLPVPPTANTYYRALGKRVVMSLAGREYKQVVQRRCLVAKVKPIHGEVTVDIRWYRATRAGDVDNRLKPALDALKGHAFGDDAKVRRLIIERDDSDKRNARIEVTITPYGEAKAA